MINEINVNSNQLKIQFNELSKKMLRIVLEKDAFFPGETVTGKIILEVNQPLQLFDIIVELKQLKGCIMDLSNKKNTNTLLDSKLYESRVNLGNSYRKSPQMQELPPSNYVFLISIQLDKNLLHSFDILIKPKAYTIRYVLSVSISSPNKYRSATSDIIIKSRAKCLPDSLYHSSCTNVRAWGLTDQGTTIMTLSYPKNNYKYLDQIPLTVTVDNTRGKAEINCIKIELLREVKIYSCKNEKEHESIKEIFKYKFPMICLSNEKKSQLFEVMIEDAEVTLSQIKYPETKNKMFLMESIDDSFIKCSYYIKAMCNFTSFVSDSSKPVVIIPINITSTTELEKEVNDKNIQRNNKEVKDIEEAIMLSQIEYEMEKEKKKQWRNDDMEDEKYIMEQIKKIDANCSPSKSQRNENDDIKYNNDKSIDFTDNTDRSHFGFIKNNVPLIYEKRFDSNENEGYNKKKFNFFDKLLEEDKIEKEDLKTNIETINSKNEVFDHNMSIFNQFDNLENKLKDYSIEKKDKKNEVIDINAL